MKIIDCFIFYNEIDLLKYRLEILYPVVDYFVLVEATRTHSGKSKPLYYQENKDLFKQYQDKIIYVCDDKLEETPAFKYSRNYDDGIWKNENHQRNSIETGINLVPGGLAREDYIMISDVDEIPNPDILEYVRDNKPKIDCMSLIMTMFYYNLTLINEQKWYHPKIMSYGFYCDAFECTPQKCRMIETRQSIKNGGWHLSYFGSPEFIKNKIMSFAHQEFNRAEYIDVSAIETKMKQKQDLFNRYNEKWNYIALATNPDLPPQYETLLSKFTG